MDDGRMRPVCDGPWLRPMLLVFFLLVGSTLAGKSIYNNHIVNLQPGAWLTWAVGQARAGRRQQAQMDDGRRPAAGMGRGRWRQQASQNCNFSYAGGYNPSRRRAA